MVKKESRKILLFCFYSFILLTNFLYPSHEFGTTNNSTSIVQSIITEVCPFAAALSVLSKLFGSQGSQGSTIDIWSTIADPDQFNSADDTFYNVSNRDKIAELRNFYYKLNTHEQQCAPFYIDSYGDVCLRSSGEIIKNFCASSSKYICCANWRDDNTSLRTLSHLEHSIKNSHTFRKRKIRPLEKKFKKEGYIDEIIINYRNELNKRIAAERQRLEKERKAQESFNRKQEWAERRVEDQNTRELDNLENRLEEIQNYKETIESCSNRKKGERNRIVDLGLRQAELCEHELIFGSEERFSTCRRRLQSIVRSIQNYGQAEHRTYKISDELRVQASCLGMRLDALGAASANAIQHDIYQEAIEILNCSADIKHAFFDADNIVAMADFVFESSYAAHEYGQLHEYEQSYRLLDFASSVYSVLKEIGKFLYLSGRGAATGCYRIGTFPFVLAKNLLTAPVDTVTGIVNGIRAIAGCLLRGMWESVTLSGDEFAQSKTAETIQAISAHLDSMSYEEKVEEGVALITELFFPVAMSKLKFVDRSKRFASYLRKVLKNEKAVVTALEAEEAGALLRRAGGPVIASIDEVVLESRFIEAIRKLNGNDINHILHKKHDWWKVVRDPNDWNQVSKIVNKVLKEGIEGPYKGGRTRLKALEMKRNIVEVIYIKCDNDVIKISNAWVKKNI